MRLSTLILLLVVVVGVALANSNDDKKNKADRQVGQQSNQTEGKEKGKPAGQVGQRSNPKDGKGKRKPAGQVGKARGNGKPAVRGQGNQPGRNNKQPGRGNRQPGRGRGGRKPHHTHKPKTGDTGDLPTSPNPFGQDPGNTTPSNVQSNDGDLGDYSG